MHLFFLKMIFYNYMCRKWVDAHRSNSNVPPFHWLGEKYVHAHSMDASNLDDVDKVLLCSRLCQTMIWYTFMKAYGNHYRVENSKNNLLSTFDSGIVLVFDMPTRDVDARNVSMNYVGVLKDIFRLDYGPMQTHVIIFRCEWIKWRDNWANPAYVWNDVGFFMVNFHKLPLMFEPFIFPSQAM